VRSSFAAAGLACQFLSHHEEQPAIGFAGAAEKLAKGGEELGFSAGASPQRVGFGAVRENGGKLGLRAVVEETVERDTEGAGELFERFDAGDGVAVLDARDVAALQAGARLVTDRSRTIESVITVACGLRNMKEPSGAPSLGDTPLVLADRGTYVRLGQARDCRGFGGVVHFLRFRTDQHASAVDLRNDVGIGAQRHRPDGLERQPAQLRGPDSG
jgi:hypothetical protein